MKTKQLILSKSLLIFGVSLLFSSSFTANTLEQTLPVSDFGKTTDGQAVQRFVLTNKRGMEAVVITYGATLVSLKVPDRDGKSSDVVLGYDDLAGYEADKPFFGATVGRYANRIAAGKFVLDGKTFQLPINNPPNSLHGGLKGFNKKVWTATDRSNKDAQVLQLAYLSADGEEGYPGNLQVKVTYTLPAETNELRIDYWAKTDKDTVLNLTNHSYFNLSNVPGQTILQHRLTLHASQFTPVDATLIPTGELRSVKGTPLDFTEPTAVGARINDETDQQIKFGNGYDHNWVLPKTGKSGLQSAAEVFEPGSGRVLEVLTSEPGIQFYTANFLDGTVPGKGGQMYVRRTALCLETQHFPDSPNHKNFPNTELKPAETFQSTTIFRFSLRK